MSLKGDVNISTFISQKEKVDMINKASIAIYMCLGDNALKEVVKEKNYFIDRSFCITMSLVHKL